MAPHLKALFLLLFALPAQLNAQFLNIVIDSSVGAPGPEEPTIAIDHKNPDHLVAGANLDNYYVSYDGGHTWANGHITSSLGVLGDPVTIADTFGGFYYFHLAIDHSRPATDYEFANKIVCQYLTNVTPGHWTDGYYAGLVDTPHMDDKPGVALDRNTNTVYACWTRFDKYEAYIPVVPTDSSNIMFSRSGDGITWSPAMRINKKAGDCSDGAPTVEGAIPCVGPNGQVYVSWASYDGITYNRSFDQGNTWMDTNISVATIPGGWNYSIPGLSRCNGLPFTGCDISNGPYRGNIYINWSDQRNGRNNTDIWISRSSDSGTSWSPPIRVNNDTGAAQQFMSSMAVDDVTGYIYVLFYDRRNYAGTPDSNLTDVYLAVSKDGASTFRNYKISQTSFFPDSAIFFGDYTFIAAYNNVVRPIWGWSSLVNDTLEQKIIVGFADSVATGIANLTGAPRQAQDELILMPNPVQDKCVITAELSAASPASLYLTDLSGRIVRQIVTSKELPSGPHSFTFFPHQTDIPPGAYLVVLKTNNGTTVQRMVVWGQ